MKFKKVAAFTMTAWMAMSAILTGCGSSGGNDGGNESGKADKIVIYQSKVEITDQLKDAAKKYEEETGVEVEIWETTGDDYIAQLKLKFSSDQMPTIFSVRKGTEAEDLKSYLADVSDMKIQEYVSDETALKADNKSYGVPYGVEGFGMVANTSMLSGEDMSSYGNMIAAMERLAGEGINPFGLGQESYFLIGHIMNTPFALMDDPIGFIEKLNNGETTMAETEEFQKFGEMMVKVRELAESPLGYTYDKEMGDFATGKTAMVHQGNWTYSLLKDFDMDFDMTIYPLPLMDNDKIAVSVPYYWAVNSQCSEGEIQAAKDFLDWLYTSETGKGYIVDEFGFVPATSNISTESLDPLSKVVAEAAASGEVISWTFDYWPAGIVDADLVPAAQEFFISPDMTAEQFIESLDAAWQNAVK